MPPSITIGALASRYPGAAALSRVAVEVRVPDGWRRRAEATLRER